MVSVLPGRTVARTVEEDRLEPLELPSLRARRGVHDDPAELLALRRTHARVLRWFNAKPSSITTAPRREEAMEGALEDRSAGDRQVIRVAGVEYVLA